MSYENPQIIVDRSAEIYAQGAASLGNIMVKSVQDLYKARAEEKAKEKKKQEAINVWESNFRSAQSEEFMKTASGIKNASYREQFIEQQTAKMEDLIDLKSKYTFNPGSATREDLISFNKKEASFKRRNEVAKQFSASITLDIEKVEENTMGQDGSTINIKGLAEDNEKFKNMAWISANANKPSPGLDFYKNWEDDVCKLDIAIDPNNDIIKKNIENGILNLEGLKLVDGKYHIKHTVDPETYTSVIVDVPDGPIYSDMLKAGGATKNGVLDNKYFDEIYSQKGSGVKNKDVLTTTGFFNRDKFLADKDLRNNIQDNEALNVLDMELDQQFSWLEMRLGKKVDKAFVKDWRSKSASEKSKYVVTEIMDQMADDYEGFKKENNVLVKAPVEDTGNKGDNMNEALSFIQDLKLDPRLKFDVDNFRDLASDIGLTVDAEYNTQKDADSGNISRFVLGEYRGKKLSVDKNDDPIKIINKIVRIKYPKLSEAQYKKIVKEASKLKPDEEASKLKPGEGVLAPGYRSTTTWTPKDGFSN